MVSSSFNSYYFVAMTLVDGSLCCCAGPERTSCLIDRMNGPQLVDSRKRGFKVMIPVVSQLHGFFRSLGNIRRGARCSTRQPTTSVVFGFTTSQSLLCITLSQISFLTNASVSSFLVQFSLRLVAEHPPFRRHHGKNYVRCPNFITI